MGSATPQLREELATIREQGYAVSLGERAVTAPGSRSGSIAHRQKSSADRSCSPLVATRSAASPGPNNPSS